MSPHLKTVLIVAAGSVIVRLIIANYPSASQYF